MADGLCFIKWDSLSLPVVSANTKPEDQFSVADLSGATLGTAFSNGNDWALVPVPSNGTRDPGESCAPILNCDYENTMDLVPLTVAGFGVDDEDARNGVLQTHTGPSFAGGGLFSRDRLLQNSRSFCLLLQSERREHTFHTTL